MEKLTYNNISKASIHELTSLSIEDLNHLAKEADITLSEAHTLKKWLYGAIALKNSHNFSNSKNNNSNNKGGNYEQVTNY